MAEKPTMVIIGCIWRASAAQPVRILNAPINTMYKIYRVVVALALKVKHALAKKEKVTATQNETKLAIA